MAKQRARRPSRGFRSSGTKPPDGGEIEVPLSDPQEFDFLPRREGPVWSPSDVETAIRKGRELLEDANRDAGLRAWRKGDMLYELYNGYPERVKRFATFLAFAIATFGLTEDEVFEYLRIRKGVPSAADAANVGRRKLSLGLRLLEKNGLQTFAALRNVELPQPDGSTCRFHTATDEQVQAALDVMDGLVPAEEGEKEEKVSRKLRSKLVERNEALRLARRKDPVLDGAHVKYVIRDGGVVLDARSLTEEQALALARFLLQEPET